MDKDFLLRIFGEISQLKHIASSKNLIDNHTEKSAQWFLIIQFINKQHKALFAPLEPFQVEKEGKQP